MSEPERTGPETTPDGHHIVVDGRKWRAQDPHIPEALAGELGDVDVLAAGVGLAEGGEGVGVLGHHRDLHVVTSMRMRSQSSRNRDRE